MFGQFLYNVEFSINDFDVWRYPQDLKNAEGLSTIFRFQMHRGVCLDITDDEFVDQINSGEKIIKNLIFSLSEKEVNGDVGAEIVAFKSKCAGDDVMVGSFKISKLHCRFQQLMEQFKRNDEQKCSKFDPCVEVVKELAPLVDEDDQQMGSLHYTLRLTCFGPSLSINQLDSAKWKEQKVSDAEGECLECSRMPSPSPSTSKAKERKFDEYSAEVNGNQLIVRVHKGDDSHLVTRVFDSDMGQDGNEIRHDKNVVSICGCEQQIDFEFPEKFSCGGGKKKKENCGCGPDSPLTEFQRKTSCVGKSFKNACSLPVIRGNLKYPGRIDGFIKLDLHDKCNPRDATEKYKKKQPTSRSVCLQADGENLTREMEGKCKIPKGIEVCKKGCADSDTDVFILKIGSKKTDKKGRKNEIELEMRTPKIPDLEAKKMETREIQVDEKDFEETKKKPAGSSPDPKKPIGKKVEVKSQGLKKPAAKKVEPTAYKGFTKKMK